MARVIKLIRCRSCFCPQGLRSFSRRTAHGGIPCSARPSQLVIASSVNLDSGQTSQTKPVGLKAIAMNAKRFANLFAAAAAMITLHAGTAQAQGLFGGYRSYPAYAAPSTTIWPAGSNYGSMTPCANGSCGIRPAGASYSPCTTGTVRWSSLSRATPPPAARTETVRRGTVRTESAARSAGRSVARMVARPSARPTTQLHRSVGRTR